MIPMTPGVAALMDDLEVRPIFRNMRLAPQTPTTGYMELRGDYAFWVAQRIVAFSDEMIRAIHAGEFSDPAADKALATS